MLSNSTDISNLVMTGLMIALGLLTLWFMLANVAASIRQGEPIKCVNCGSECEGEWCRACQCCAKTRNSFGDD